MHRYPLVIGVVILFAACDKGPKDPVAAAAARNNVAALRTLLADGHKADAHADSWTPLIWAARSGAADAMKVLLDAGADVNLPGPTGDDWDATPLQHAILERQPRAVELLLERGADANRGAGGSIAPLLLAAGDTDPAFVTSLLAHGANPNIADHEGHTPLSLAVAAGSLHGPDRPMFGGCRVETVRALAAHNPVLRVTHNEAGNNALWWARFQRCEGVLRLIGE